ncbi:Sugar kinase of the NBD/HSP70 family, may contain an N-terminal HTH domain [Thermomonospora echinospora]|uniref:Sugar kinase of the NBD/HSP70 family, may contain an N-terminal HTH domain n=1 Tax=Thermomonospora echinospora TaxID=1992 RepID=A0A1H5XFE1_9ACTN|nr:ROK family transcriptional regulator [Thermomonospora echinospora]SEG10462.1 Sugar kinase of the NBD/HSP70 family, may contain an N-terminal HTH domain [Thermomonospora echinospora]
MPRHPSTSGELLRLIREEGVSTRAELGRLTGLSRPAVTLRVTELVAHGLVTERPGELSSGGRPPARLEFNAAGGAVLVANLGHRRGQAAVCDLAGGILVQSAPDLPTGREPAELAARLLDHWDELLDKAGLTRAAVRGVGLGRPGNAGAPGGPGVDGADLRPVVAERFPVPAYLDNDVNVAALGEYQARYRGRIDDLLFVKLSTGIGAGLIAGGRIQRGALGAAGEIGHIPVRDGGGTPCRCGNLDCVEAVAGGAALLARSGAADLTELAVRARGGDPEVVALVREAGRRIGEVIAAAVNLLNPAVVVLGGDLTGAYEPLIAGVREVVYQRATALATGRLRIEPSMLGDTAGLAGCAAMVLDRILSPAAVDESLAAR